ncbi:TRAP-like protein, putative [Plasmodium knowlesi strain H]|uniref:TRAP-like protein, putative n=3 Tax=Plasmodium knowlesi TaxID=5850 RepID=A0A5K1UQ60_PLAKH|nr:TRAP-like protein, putative [Plasmodium knowlesi strain H]OTN64712.1 putative TRAP-like protein [Plasmodium knowlesi]CAA9989160.1 TRAP-like protein, putative [Plasmodium knowlesi strain H]SBO27379.1 TRAP-like protein, putative [Plasmodium knowlesi strain H]SBO27509.1 TRAP-like protein, putative [Plasmodium knowlesi strain H]VVS78634.1 TRAP-like protein, putative [Plasmodium knowlesi strain H]|eukprot:XP_002261507.1 hypothetical protein, conserved in Plasmodium species [Plasmodium knowlesi strain H]
MRRIFRVFLNGIFPFFLFSLIQVESNGLIEKVTSKGDLDLVIVFDVGFKETKEKKRSKALENIAELARNLLVGGERNVNLTYVTYDSVSVQTAARADNRSAKGNSSSGNRTNGSLERFRRSVMQTEMKQSQQSSNHLKVLNYVGMKHFYDAEDTSTKMIIMFMNTDGIPARDNRELNLVHYLLDRKNITLNIITKVNFKSYCHYLHKVGPNTNELLRCVLKNSFYHRLILTYTMEKFYDDIATNAKCSDWSDWSECSVSCNMGYHFSKRNTMENIENSLGGKYKRTGKNCTDQRSLVIQECFNTSCDHSLDICDIQFDLSLLIDDSSDISQDYWLKYILKPIRNLISHLNMGSNLLNISITTFSQETYNWINFSSNLARNRDELLLFLEYWRFNFGGASNNLSSALNYMNDHVLNSNEARPNAHKVLVIFNTGDVSNKMAMGAKEIVRNIKMKYAADVYSICLKNTRDDNCGAISGASISTDQVGAVGITNQEEGTNSNPVNTAPFFYSYSNVSEFRDQITEIQKNICKNAHQAIVTNRRQRRRNLRRAEDEAGGNAWRGGRGSQHGHDDEEDDESEEGEEVERRDGQRGGKGTREEEVEGDVTSREDTDGETELETKSTVLPSSEAASEPVAESETKEKAEYSVMPDIVLESLPRGYIGAVPDEPPNENGKLAQNLHVPKSINIIPPSYPNNGGNVKGLNKNRAILKSFTHLERIDDAEEEEVDVEPTQKPLKKYSSEYNIDALPSYKNRGIKNLICRLLRFLFRKKKQYKLRKMDPKDQEKIKQFISDVKALTDSEGIYLQMEKEIEEDFNVMLENIFKNIGLSSFSDSDFDSASVSSYGSYIDDEEELGLDSTLPCSWFYIDAAQMNVDHLASGGNGIDVDGRTDADTDNGSIINMDNDSNEEDTPSEGGKSIHEDVSIVDILVKEGGFATIEKGMLKRRKRSIDQTQGQSTSSEETHSEKNEDAGESRESMEGGAILPGSLDEKEKVEYNKAEGEHSAEAISSHVTSSTQSLSPEGNKAPSQRKFKSKFDIIQRFRNKEVVVDDKTGISFDTEKYPPLKSKEGNKPISHLEEHTEEKKDDSASVHILGSPQRTNCSKESNEPCDQGGVLPQPVPMNYKKTEQNKATIIKERIKPNGDIKVQDNYGMIKGEQNKTSSATKNQTHVHDPNDQVQYNLQQGDINSAWGTGQYDVPEEEEFVDSSIYKYSASFALIAVVVLGAAFLYIRSQKNLMEPVPVTFNDFGTHNKEKKVECREQHVELRKDETSWQ